MSLFTFFLATSQAQKRLTRDEIESLILALLHEKHLLFPSAIFVGEARNEVRGEAFDTAVKEGTLLDAAHVIIPNDPMAMLDLTKDLAKGGESPIETLWYYGNDEIAFREALRRLPLRERDACFCFPSLSHYLAEECGWYEGAVIYVLARPFPLDFMHVLFTTALPLIDYPVSDCLTFSSRIGGGFPNLESNPLRQILQRYFGPDLEMKETADLASL